MQTITIKEIAVQAGINEKAARHKLRKMKKAGVAPKTVRKGYWEFAARDARTLRKKLAV